jgi:type IV pilus assembly protein PilB
MSYNPQFAKLGEILVKENIVSEADLEVALSEQRAKGDKLGNILIASGKITEDQLVSAFSLQLGYKAITEDELLKAPEEVVKLIPEDFSRENNVITLKTSETSIYVAMEDPEDVSTLDSIKKLTALNPEVLVAGKTAITNAIDQLYDKIKKSGEVESAISNIKVVRGSEDDGDELDLESEQVSAEDAPFVKLVNLILTEAIKEDSSDIHIEPGRNEVSVRIRIDGILGTDDIGGDIIFTSTPSILILTDTSFLPGSIWISEESSLIASVNIRFTSFTNGASSAETCSDSKSSSSPSSSLPLTTLMLDIALSTSPDFLILSYN